MRAYDSKQGTYSIKLVLLGEHDVGKTSILNRFVNDQYSDHIQATVGATYITKQVFQNGKTIDLYMWDTAGEEKYRSLVPMYYRNANAAFIVFDISQRRSFEDVRSWFEEVRQTNPDCLLVLCGNKVDLADRQVAIEEAQQLANRLNVAYFELSAKLGTEIHNLFDYVISNSSNKPILLPKGQNTSQIVDRTFETQKTNKCC